METKIIPPYAKYKIPDPRLSCNPFQCTSGNVPDVHSSGTDPGVHLSGNIPDEYIPQTVSSLQSVGNLRRLKSVSNKPFTSYPSYDLCDNIGYSTTGYTPITKEEIYNSLLPKYSSPTELELGEYISPPPSPTYNTRPPVNRRRPVNRTRPIKRGIEKIDGVEIDYSKGHCSQGENCPIKYVLCSFKHNLVRCSNSCREKDCLKAHRNGVRSIPGTYILCVRASDLCRERDCIYNHTTNDLYRMVRRAVDRNILPTHNIILEYHKDYKNNPNVVYKIALKNFIYIVPELFNPNRNGERPFYKRKRR